MIRIPTSLAFTLAAALLSPAAMAASGTITVDGEIKASTCTVDSASQTIALQMGEVDVAALEAGKRAGQKVFDINLTCLAGAPGAEVGVRFGSASFDPTTKNMGLTRASTATNVTVGIWSAEGTHQPMGAAATTWIPVPVTSTPITLSYSAWYVASTGAAATAGTANADGEFFVVYR